MDGESHEDALVSALSTAVYRHARLHADPHAVELARPLEADLV